MSFISHFYTLFNLNMNKFQVMALNHATTLMNVLMEFIFAVCLQIVTILKVLMTVHVQRVSQAMELFVSTSMNAVLIWETQFLLTMKESLYYLFKISLFEKGITETTCELFIGSKQLHFIGYRKGLELQRPPSRTRGY